MRETIIIEFLLSSIISYSREALQEDGPHIMALANLEGLSAHARSVAVRTGRKD